MNARSEFEKIPVPLDGASGYGICSRSPYYTSPLFATLEEALSHEAPDSLGCIGLDAVRNGVGWAWNPYVGFWEQCDSCQYAMKQNHFGPIEVDLSQFHAMRAGD
jgi:hypothetical protein